MDRMLSREEVAGILGISPSSLTELVKDNKFPRPVPLGKSARTDRWPVRIVQRWVAEREGLVYGTGGTPGQTAEPHYFTGQDVALHLRTTATKVFAALVEKGLLSNAEDEFNRYRPTETGFKTGYFWRIEKYSTRDEKAYYQTVFTARGKEQILDIVRQSLQSGRQR